MKRTTLIGQFLVLSIISTSFGFLAESNTNTGGVRYSVNTTSTLDSVMALVLNTTQDLGAKIQNLRSELQSERLQREKLEKEVQSKNDQEFFIRSDVSALNSSLIQEIKLRKTGEVTIQSLNASLMQTMDIVCHYKRDLDLAKNHSESLRRQISKLENRIEMLQQNQSNESAKCSEVITHMEERLQATVANATATKTCCRDNGSVFFTYHGAETSMPSTLTNALKFKFEVTNTGRAYDSSKGIFTAPVSGTYAFSLTLGAATNSFLNCYIKRNNQAELAEVFTSVQTGYSSASSSAVTHLNAGDTVKVSGCQGNGTIDPYKSSFSGVLLQSG